MLQDNDESDQLRLIKHLSFHVLQHTGLIISSIELHGVQFLATSMTDLTLRELADVRAELLGWEPDSRENAPSGALPAITASH